MSVTNLFKTFRLNMAVKLFREGNDNIADVAYKVGFNTPSYFTKVFKSHFGVLSKDFVKN